MIGSNSLSISDKTAQIVEVESVLVPGIFYKPWVKRHEDFGTIYNDNEDLLLIKTATKMEPKLKGNDFVVNSICFPEPEMALEYKSTKPLGMAHISGWSSDGYEKDLAPILKDVQVPIISNDLANKVLKETRHYFGDEGLYYVYNFTFSKKDLATMAIVPPGTGIIPLTTFNGTLIRQTEEPVLISDRQNYGPYKPFLRTIATVV